MNQFFIGKKKKIPLQGKLSLDGVGKYEKNLSLDEETRNPTPGTTSHNQLLMRIDLFGQEENICFLTLRNSFSWLL